MGLLEARCYIHKIRNPQKKQYAKDYLHQLQWGIKVNKNKYQTLSFMTKQAVRLNLDELFDIL